MQDNNYILIQGWMRNSLNLSGNDLLVYAIIYGFSQTDTQRYTGTLQYLADWCGATKQGILKNLKNLLDKGLIAKENNQISGVNSVAYYTTQLNTPLNSVEHPIKLSLTNNNIDNNIKENNNTNTKVLVEKSKKKNLYEKCMDSIIEFTEDEDLRDSLVNYLRFRLEVKDKPLYANQFKAMLDKIRRFTDSKTEALQIVQQSIDRGYLSFFPVSKAGMNTNIKSTACESSVNSIKMTEDEKAHQKEFQDKMRSEGKQIEF